MDTVELTLKNMKTFYLQEGGIMKIGQGDFTNLVGFVAVAFIVSSLVSCSSKPEDAIVGRWRGGTEVMELFKDGTITIANVADKEKYMSGKYTFIDKDKIKVELGGLWAAAGPIVLTVSISGDELTLTFPDGNVDKYRREK